MTEAAAIAWYRPEAWLRVKQLAADPERMEASYAAWALVAAAACAELEQRGIRVLQVEVEPDDLVRWCQRRQVPLDELARARFAAERARSWSGGVDAGPMPVP